MTTLDKFLSDWREKSKAATPGPWLGFAGCLKHAKGLAGVNGPDCKSAQESNDSTFIAQARTDIPRLVAMVEVAISALNDCTRSSRPCEERAYRAIAELERLAAGGEGE